MDADRTAVRIFDLVNANKVGQAEGALETALAKYPDSDSLRAAEALVLLRLDQPDKAKARAVALSGRNLTEPKAINAVVHVLQQCCCWGPLASLYERLRPLQNDRQIAENLVQTYVRMGDYAKAQLVATQLYRAHADPKYQIWMVQACLGQVPADSTDHLMLRLSAKLLDASVLTEKGVVTPATTRTYVDVLVQQGQYAEAVAFLCSERGAKIGLRETRLELLARVLVKHGKLSLANAAARQLWGMHPDNWTPFEIYADTIRADAGDDAGETLTLAAERAELRAVVRGADADHTLDAALGMARTLQAAQMAERSPQRGPFLAELALLERKGDADGLASAVVRYVKRFYRKPCCFLDVSTFLTSTSSALVYAWSTAEAEDDAAADAQDADKTKIAAHTRCILGLRCFVASWGTTPETVPDVAKMRELMAKCATLYDEAKPLSAALEWNEEGHCDAYISVALNIALHGFHAHGKANGDLSWPLAGLQLMQAVERRVNNSVWLMYSACFAGLLGLTDTAAHHQLAFKSVQHDTMTHLGYWPLVRGLAREEVATWEMLAMNYYERVERDCSLLRAKVFTFTSWPAMHDVRRFQARQEGSLVRWLAPPNACVAALTQCQTQKNIFELLASVSGELRAAWDMLGPAGAEDRLWDNTDWTVARSVVLGNIHADKVRELTDSLVQMPSFAARHTEGRRLLASLLLLADVAAVEQQRQAAANAPKPRKGKKNAAAASTADEKPGCSLHTPLLTAQGSQPWECLPAVAPLASALMPVLVAVADGGVAAARAVPAEAAAAVNAALAAVLDGIVASPVAEPFERFLYPEAYVLAALVHIAPLTHAPAATQWAATLHAAVEAAVHKYESGAWSVVHTRCGDGAADAGEGADALVKAATDDAFVGVLVQEKARRVKNDLADLLLDLSVSARRK